jgi:NAD(P)-dependent dehydrogenase (short-subunit alcohol dehydrogenase family)
MSWTTKDIPTQAGRLAIVTGANTGLGYETALELAGAGAEVVVAARNPDKGGAAVARILTAHPAAKVRLELLDLSRLSDVAAFAERIAARHDTLDQLVNNAGVMMPPKRQVTPDGFELQFGVNYLAHYALTAHLLPLLRRGTAPRVVNLSSGAHHTGQIRFDDLEWQRRYSPWPAYSQSKLAMLMFAFELDRRSRAGGWGIMSNAAHPGFARTELIANGPGDHSVFARLNRTFMQPWMSQDAAQGALPQLFAATSPDAVGGGYYGPSRLFELVGPPKVARVAKQARDQAVAKKLWEVSATLTGVSFPG